MSERTHRLSIKKWPEGERPREKLIQFGAEALSDAELLAILLRVGNEGSSAIDIGRLLIDTFDGLCGIDRAHVEDILLIKGLGIAKTAQLKAAIEYVQVSLAAEIPGRLKPEISAILQEAGAILAGGVV